MLLTIRNTISYALRYAMPRKTLALNDVISSFWAMQASVTSYDYEHIYREVTKLRKISGFAHPCHNLILDDFEFKLSEKIKENLL